MIPNTKSINFDELLKSELDITFTFSELCALKRVIDNVKPFELGAPSSSFMLDLLRLKDQVEIALNVKRVEYNA